MSKIKFEFTVEEANQILASLGDQPYVKVADLIVSIRQQAMEQINAPAAANDGVGAAVATAQ